MESRTSIREPLDQALAAELQRLDRVIARSWLFLALTGGVGGAIVAVAVAPILGVAMAVAAIVVAVIFGVISWRLTRAPLTLSESVAVALVEGLMPWAIFVVLTATQGAAYAIASWVPPLLYAAAIVAATARLRPWSALTVGASGGAAYLIAYFAYVRGHLPVGASRLLLHEPPMQLSRSLSLIAAYMAPEQAVAERIDVRADLFSVGVVLWEMLALQRLFARSNPVATLHALVAGPVPPITDVRAEIDPAWNAFVARSLAREASGRWSSAAEMATALDALPGARSDRPMEELAALLERVRNLPPQAPTKTARSEEPTLRQAL